MFGLELAAMLAGGLAILFAIAYLIIVLLPPVIYTCSAAGCGYMAWGAGDLVPFDDLALAMTTILLISALTLFLHALPAWRRAGVRLWLISDAPKRGRRK